MSYRYRQPNSLRSAQNDFRLGSTPIPKNTRAILRGNER